jgi:glycosyltransferase involved in cell wall biosynthesis
MRVLILINTFFPHIGGAETAVHNLAEGLVANGHEVIVGCTTQINSTGDEYYHSYKLERYHLPRGSSRFKVDDWFLALAAAPTVHRWQPDFILANFVWPVGYAAMQLRKFFRIPVIVVSHTIDIDTIPSLRYGFRLNSDLNKKIEWTVQNADGLIAISKRTTQIYQEIGAQPVRIANIPNAINFESMNSSIPEARHLLGISPQKKVILSVGRNVPLKGYENLIQMVPTVAEKVNEVLFVLVGENMSSLSDLVIQNNVSKYVKLYEKVLPAGISLIDKPTSPMQTISTYYKAANLLAMPSILEGLPMVGIEAMASGLPIVAHQIPGASDLIRDNVNGRLVPIGDNVAFIQALIDLLQNDSFRVALGKQARDDVKRFDRLQVANQIIDFAQQVCK